MLSRVEEKDELASVSFALLGVLIILLSIFAVAYISRIERINYENELKEDKISELEESIDNTLDTLENKINYIGVKSAFEANAEFDGNVSEIFQTHLERYLNKKKSKGGWERGETEINLERFNLSISPKTVSVNEHIPNMEEGGKYDKVTTDSPGVAKKVDRTFCYQVTGKVNLSAEKGTLGMNKGRELDITIDVPYPYLNKRMNSFGGSLKGEKSHLARITEFMLTTVAQYRVMTGYGMQSFEDDGIDDRRTTENIITKRDVELAVNLGLVLEIAYKYRSYDPDQIENISENVDPWKQDRVKDLIFTYFKRGRIDPGDVISLYHGYSYDGDVVDENESMDLAIDKVIAQAIHTLVDQFILKYFEIMGLVEITSKILSDLQEAKEKLYESITDLFSGDDEGDIDPAEVETVRNWVKTVFLSSGMINTNLLMSYYQPYNTINDTKINGYPGLEGKYSYTNNFIYLTKFNSINNTWYNYSCGHHGEHRRYDHTCNKTVQIGEDKNGTPIMGRCGAEERISGHDYKDGHCNFRVEGGPVLFEPVNILKNNAHLWQRFYDNSYKNSVDQDPGKIKNTVKDIITKFAERVVNNPEIKRLVEKYAHVKVDPADKRSLFDDIHRNLNAAISDVFDYFREHPDVIADILKSKMHQKGDMKVGELKKFIKDNYDELVHKDTVLNDTAERTAMMLTEEDSPYLEVVSDTGEIYRGGLNEKVDFTWFSNRSIKKEEASTIIQNGNCLTQLRVKALKEDIRSHLEELYKEIKKREIQECDNKDNISHSDGLVIQALDDYQYNTSYENENKSDDKVRTRGGSSFAWIELITPNPATQGRDEVSFVGNTSVNPVSIEWKSGIDGYLGNDLEFNMSAQFMTPGLHEITLTVISYDGFIYSDNEELFINIPPKAQIGTIDPEVGTEDEKVHFESSSWDPDGVITSLRWEFGDVTNGTGNSVNHTYSSPGTYTVNLTVEDDKGGVNTISDEILIDDAPFIKHFSPTPGDSWSTDTEISVKFSEPVDPSSLEYSIDPGVQFSESWENENRGISLTPNEPYSRETSYNLNIMDVVDVDNGTNSSLPSPRSFEWRTKDHGEVVGIYPDEHEPIELQRSIVLVVNESAEIRNLTDFIDQDWNWSYSWNNSNKHLVLDHDEFPSGEEIELTFHLSELRALEDDSPFEKDNLETFTVTFKTRSFAHPKLVSTEPVNSEKEVFLDEPIRLGFDKQMNTSSFNVSITPSIGNLSYVWERGNDSVLIYHDEFLPDQRYKVFAKGLCIDGYKLIVSEENRTWNPFTFRTKDSIEPKVVEISPEDGTEHYLSDSPVIIKFNKGIDPASIDFTCSPNPGWWEPQWDEGGSMVVLHHEDFPAGEHVTFILEDAADCSGKHLEHQTIVDFQISDNGKYKEGNLFQRKLWTILGGGPWGTSLFDMAESFMKVTTRGMLLTGQMSNTEYRVPLMMREGFSYGPTGSNSTKRLEFLIDTEPEYIDIEEFIKKSQPSGHHFTKINKISTRPFETHWDILVPRTKISLNISKKSPYIIGDEEPKFLSMNRTYELGFNITIDVTSGWALEDVNYSHDGIDLDAVLHFLNKVWELVKKPLSYLLDGLYKILELFNDLVDKLKEYANSLIKLLGRLVQEVISDTIKPIAQKIIDNRDEFEDFERALSLLGIDLGVEVFSEGRFMTLPNTKLPRMVYMKMEVGGSLFGTSIDFNFYVLDDDVVAAGNLTTNSMDMGWQVDPKANSQRFDPVYKGWFQCQGYFGEKGDGAVLNLTIPEIRSGAGQKEEEYEYSAAEVFPALSAVTIPIGPIVVSDFDFGLTITYVDMNHSATDLLKGSIRRVFWDTVKSMKDAGINLNYIVDFVKTFTKLFVEELIRLAKSIVKAVELFFTCAVNKVDVALSFGLQSGQSLVDFMIWMGNEVRHLIQGLADKKPTCSANKFPRSILEYTELGVELGFEDSTVAYFSANVPALASIVGKDLGEWKITFGLELSEDFDLVSGQLVEW